MKPFRKWTLLLALAFLPANAYAQTPQKLTAPDDRFKTDILIVVAHPDDEAFFTPYAVKALNDMQKRVAVIFSTRGGSGANRFTRERGPAMAHEREIEAREACAKLGIKNVWFLDGKDSASQNVLDSLSSWGHGANLEKLVSLIRLTRPDIILTHHPGMFIGENHGDHQATGVLVVEAFDLAGNAAAFPAQLSGDMAHYESYLSSLQPWQAKKIYLGSDADDGRQFDGTGPTYSPREISPTLKKPYWRLALDSAMSHKTQFPEDIERISKMTDEQLEKMMNDPDTGWWGDPATLIFGKSVVGGSATDPVFSHVDENPVNPVSQITSVCGPGGKPEVPRVELGGPWHFYAEFYPAHGLCQLKTAKVPEIGVKSGSTLIVPLVVRHGADKPAQLSLTLKLPDGWKSGPNGLKFALPAEAWTPVSIHVETPLLSAEELKKRVPEEVRLTAEIDGKPAGEVVLRVALKSGGLPQSL
jgi:LmbE family N-acetylglucosaminyl deacetylase